MASEPFPRAPSATPISVVILANNEEANLPRCLDSLAWCDDVVVVDSGSTDGTVALAKARGCRVLFRPLDDYGTQRNFANAQGGLRHPWVFHLDADEVFTEALRAECARVVAEDRFSAFYVPSRLLFRGRWLRHVSGYPVYQMRLMRLGEAAFVAHGHGQREAFAARGLGTLREPYDHHNFSKGLAAWFRRHVGYAEREVAEPAGPVRLRALLLGSATERRRQLKNLSLRLPCQPILKFLWLYVGKRGFLDGMAGLRYCAMMCAYQIMIDTLAWEARPPRIEPRPAPTRGRPCPDPR